MTLPVTIHDLEKEYRDERSPFEKGVQTVGGPVRLALTVASIALPFFNQALGIPEPYSSIIAYTSLILGALVVLVVKIMTPESREKTVAQVGTRKLNELEVAIASLKKEEEKLTAKVTSLKSKRDALLQLLGDDGSLNTLCGQQRQELAAAKTEIQFYKSLVRLLELKLLQQEDEEMTPSKEVRAAAKKCRRLAKDLPQFQKLVDAHCRSEANQGGEEET